MSTWSKATRKVATVLMLTGIAANAAAFSPSVPSWSSDDRQVQFRGKIICTNCSLEDARKSHPEIVPTRLQTVTHDRGQMVVEVDWASNPRWQDQVMTPEVVLRADDTLLQQFANKANHAKTLQVTGVLSHAGRLYVGEVRALE